MKNEDMLVIWTRTPDLIKIKDYCIKKIGRKNYGGVRFNIDHGDIPVHVISPTTGYPVVNPRGRAYGLRNRLQFRNKRENFKGLK